MEYSDKVMDHFANPRNTGRIENPSGQGTVGNPTCGDLMTIYIDVDDNDVIQDIKFETFGCDGLPPVKMHCSNLAADALRAAIDDYKQKNQ